MAHRKAFRVCNGRTKNKSHIIETAVEQYITMCVPFYGRNVLHTNKNTCSGIAWQRLLAQTSCCGRCCFLLHHPKTNRIANSPFRLFRRWTQVMLCALCAHFSICSSERRSLQTHKFPNIAVCTANMLLLLFRKLRAVKNRRFWVNMWRCYYRICIVRNLNHIIIIINYHVRYVYKL